MNLGNLHVNLHRKTSSMPGFTMQRRSACAQWTRLQ